MRKENQQETVASRLDDAGGGDNKIKRHSTRYPQFKSFEIIDPKPKKKVGVCRFLAWPDLHLKSIIILPNDVQVMF